ncbi:MAG: hypothetical protein ACRC11_14875 [Xenococcaceae cyanobacterium]
MPNTATFFIANLLVVRSIHLTPLSKAKDFTWDELTALLAGLGFNDRLLII